MAIWSLDSLVDPVGAGRFFGDYFESRNLLIQRNKPGYFSQLLTLDDIDRLLTTLAATDEDISVVNAAEKITSSDYVYANDTINVDKLLRLHQAGATIILNHLHRRHTPLAELCAALELEFSAPFQTNVYLTPATAQGFKPHFDTHDVFVLQVAGAKRWRLYGTPIELALKGHGSESRQDNPGPVSEEFDLKAGDTLYIPRGLVHDAASTEESSLHITVGVLAWTWFDFILEAVETLASSDREMRAALPRVFAREDFDRTAFRATFARLAARLTNGADCDAVLDRFAERFIDRRRPFLRGQIAELAELDQLSLDSVVSRRPFLFYSIKEDEEAVRVRFPGGEIALPSHAAGVLRQALEMPRLKVRDLTGELDDAGKVVLIRRLIREGLLQTCDREPANGPS